MNVSKDLTLAGMAGVISLTSSVDIVYLLRGGKSFKRWYHYEKQDGKIMLEYFKRGAR